MLINSFPIGSYSKKAALIFWLISLPLTLVSPTVTSSSASSSHHLSKNYQVVRNCLTIIFTFCPLLSFSNICISSKLALLGLPHCACTSSQLCFLQNIIFCSILLYFALEIFYILKVLVFFFEMCLAKLAVKRNKNAISVKIVCQHV